MDKRKSLRLRERFTAGENHHRAIGAQLTDARDDFLDACHELECVIRIAKIAGEIASGKSHENGGRSRPRALTLDAEEDFSELQHRLSPAHRHGVISRRRWS